MADRNGYIGRAPGDSSVIVARKVYEPTGVQTDFTFNSGYTPGYCDVYLNGVRLIDEKDFTASNGSTVGLTSAAQSGDVVELVVYKAYNLGVPLADVTGNLDVTGNISASSSITADGAFYGDGSNLSNIAGVAITQYIDANSLTVLGSPGVSTITRLGATDLNVTGIITANGLSGNVTGAALTITGNATFNSNVTIGGTLTYEDVTNVDALGIVTARAGVNVSGGQLLVGSGVTIGIAGVATFSGTSDVHLLDSVRLNVGDGSDLAIYHDGNNSYIQDSGTGVLRIASNQIQVTNAAASEVQANFIEDGAVELYHNNVKTFETTASGATIQGNLTVENSTTTPVVTSTSSDYVAKFESTDAYARLIVEDNGSTSDGNGIQVQSDNIKILAGNETALSATKDGSTEIYYNNSKKWETTNDGTVTTGIATATNGFSGTLTGAAVTVTDRITIVKSAGPVLELTTNTGGNDSSIHLSEGATGSTNNGGAVVYSAADNRLDICCGTTLTTKRISITRDTGAVGVGTTNPATGYKLTVEGDLSLGENGGASNTFIDQRQDGDLHLINSGRTAQGGSGAPGVGGVGINRYNNISGGTSLFRDFAVYNGKDSKVLVVDGSTSKVGVGTDLPSSRVHVTGDDSASSRIEIDRDNGGLLYLGSTGSAGYIQTPNSNAIDVYTAASKRVTVGSGGDVDIYGTAAGVSSVTWDASANSLIFKDDSFIKMGDGSDLSLYHDGSNSYIKDNGTGQLILDGEAVILQYGSNSKLTTTTAGVSVTGNVGLSGELDFTGPAHKYIDFYTKASDNTLYNATIRLVNHDSSDFDNAINMEREGRVQLYHAGNQRFETTNDGVSITGIATCSEGLDTVGLLRESFNTVAGKLSDNTNIDLEDGMVHYFSTQETTTSTPNIRYSSSKSLNNMLSTGDAISITVITTAAAGGYSANWTIDGSAVTEEWVGGSAPSAGGSDGLDIYGITILKTGDGAYKFIGNLTNAT